MTLTSHLRAGLAALLLTATLASPGVAQERSVRMLSTTSTENSGLLSYLLPIFESKTGIRVHVVAVGTGQALRAARNGDADVLMVHDKASELKFIAGGHGIDRREVMYNDFIIVGPREDPAKIGGNKDAIRALQMIKKSGAAFVSRGDDSGTHKAERRLWRAAGIEPEGRSNPWYREAGSGMGATLNIAAGMNAYTLTDRGTWLSFRNRRGLSVLVEGDPLLFNQYGIMLVNPARHPHVKVAEGRALIEWITSPEGQKAIGDFTINGQRLFTPNYRGGGS
ncbi:MAG: substrate-binding domain-containing protein [Alphaproteobacteria bacterium]|nr:substrate-binding domain-containing protein [Alphaproteobacteria bacterium]